MYRFFEMLPGALSWATLIAIVLVSWQQPVWAAIFVIVFDTYWLFKTVYLSLHLRSSFNTMRKNLEIDWLLKLKTEKPHWQSVYHLVILPMFQEPEAIIRESIESLKKIHYPKDRLIIVLATEERGGTEYMQTAEKIAQHFSNDFFKIIVTQHPAHITGELAGKGSNETWAIQEVKRLIIDPLHISYEQILVSVFDVDTQVYPDYFAVLTYNFLSCENPQRSSFQPIPLFTNNIYQAPAFARVVAFSATFWQMMQQSRPERLTTFSSHSMPFKALVEIGYWQTDVVSEDSRIFWQCYLHYHGDWRVVPLFYPVSMDANVAPTFWGTMVNIYKQQRRWGYGVENVPYLLEGFRTNKKITAKSKWYWSFTYLESFHSLATNVLIIFLLGWLPVLIGSGNFGTTVLAYNLPDIAGWIIRFSSIGIITSAILSLLILPPHPEGLKKREYVLYLLQWILMPFTLIVFGAIPALDAQTRLLLGKKWKLGFWVTPKHRV